MNIIKAIFARLLANGRYRKAAALLPLLAGMSLREFVTGAQSIYGYMMSGKASKKEIALLFAAILYFVSPVDLIPDVIPIAGVLDDIVIATLVFGYLHRRAVQNSLESRSD